MKEVQLECFFTVAECGSFSAAAEKLYVTQPAVSKQIRLLEEEWGISLFDRKSRSVELTAAGKIMLQHLRQASIAFNAALEQAKLSDKAPHTQAIRIGVYDCARFTLLSQILGKFIVAHPNVSIAVEECHFTALNAGLRNNRYDLIITFNYMLDNLPFVQTLPLMKANHIAMISRQHPLAAKPDLQFTDLKDECFYIPAQEADELSVVNAQDICAASGFRMHRFRLVPNIKSALFCMELNLGAVILDDCVYMEHFDDYVSIPANYANPLSVGWRKDNVNPLIPEIAQEIKKNCHSLVNPPLA